MKCSAKPWQKVQELLISIGSLIPFLLLKWYCFLQVQSVPSPALSSHSTHEKSSKKKKRDRLEYEEGQDIAEIERPIKKLNIKPLEPPPR